VASGGPVTVEPESGASQHLLEPPPAAHPPGHGLWSTPCSQAKGQGTVQTARPESLWARNSGRSGSPLSSHYNLPKLGCEPGDSIRQLLPLRGQLGRKARAFSSPDRPSPLSDSPLPLPLCQVVVPFRVAGGDAGGFLRR